MNTPTNTIQRPQKTPKIPHCKANTRRERINAGKYNFGSNHNPNYTIVCNFKNNSDTISTYLTFPVEYSCIT